MISVDVRHVHRRKIRIVHIGWLPRRVHVHQGISAARHRRSVVRQRVGLHRLLQRDQVDKPHAHAVQTLRTGISKNPSKLPEHFVRSVSQMPTPLPHPPTSSTGFRRSRRTFFRIMEKKPVSIPASLTCQPN